MTDTSGSETVEMTVIGDVYTTLDDLGNIPAADLEGDQLGGMDPL